MLLLLAGSAGSKRASDRDEAHHRADEFLATTPWRPNLIRTVGGAIAYPLYGFFTRMMMKLISRREAGSTDTSRIHELTDWRAVERLTRDVLALVEPTSERRTAMAANYPEPRTSPASEVIISSR